MLSVRILLWFFRIEARECGTRRTGGPVTAKQQQYLSRFSNEELFQLYDELDKAMIDAFSNVDAPQNDRWRTTSNKFDVKAVVDALSDAPCDRPGEREQQAKAAARAEMQRRIKSGEGPEYYVRKADEMLRPALDEVVDIEKTEAARFRRRITKAPPIIPEVSGRGWMNTGPKPAQALLNWPPNYPQELIPQTTLIIGDAIKKFPVQTQTLQLCKYVISELTPHICEAVRSQKMQAGQVDGILSDLLHYILVENCDNDNERFRLKQETKKSDEWLEVAKRLVTAASEPAATAGKEVVPNSTNSRDRRLAVDAYIAEVFQRT